MAERPRTIALDVDGVLLDIDTPWREKYNRLYGDNVVWDIHTLVKPECGLKYYDLRTPYLYDEVLPAGELAATGTELDRGTDYRLGLRGVLVVDW